MKIFSNKFAFPYKVPVLYSSVIILLIPLFLLPQFVFKISFLLQKIILITSSFISLLGFIYCAIGFHFQTIRGDELKLRIHLESLNVAFTTALVSFFIMIFIFLNFYPTMLNWILVILSIVGIISYLLATQFIKEKYQWKTRWKSFALREICPRTIWQSN